MEEKGIKGVKTPAPRCVKMYKKAHEKDTPPENFELLFGGKLASDNRWVIMANMIPWSEFEAEYAERFSASMGAPAKTLHQ